MAKTFKMLGAAFFSFLILFFVVVDVLWVYFKFFAPDSYTELVVNASTIETVDDKRAICQVVYYENVDGSGVELLDVKFNSYSDLNKTNISSFGVQIVGSINDLQSNNNAVYVAEHGFLGLATEFHYYFSFFSKTVNSEKLYFYQESDNLNYTNVTSSFDDFGYIRVDINDSMYALKPGVKRSESSFLWETYHTVSSFSDFIVAVHDIVKSCPVGNFAKTFIFKDMFKLYEVQNGKYVDVSNQDNIFTNMYIDVTHYTTGAKTAKDSIFNIIKYDTNFTVSGSSLLDEHFSDENLYKLTENDFYFVYDETVPGHKGFLKTECKNYLLENNIKKLYIVIDKDFLTSIDCMYLGLYSSGFEEFNIVDYVVVENGVKTAGGALWV